MFPDYTKYSAEDLLDAYNNINKGKYPDRLKLIETELQNKNVVLPDYSFNSNEVIERKDSNVKKYYPNQTATEYSWDKIKVYLIAILFSILLYIFFGDQLPTYKEYFAKKLEIIIEKFGLDPIYTVTVLTLLITLSYWNNFKNWEKHPGWIKGLAGSALFGSIVMLFLSFLRLIGLLKI